MEQQRVLNGRTFDPNILTKIGMANLVDVVTIQGWNHLFESPVSYLHEPEVREFFYKMELLEGDGIKTIEFELLRVVNQLVISRSLLPNEEMPGVQGFLRSFLKRSIS
ncbi:hypothetical protein H5410_006866 [Solanum commersonii]|uniref:Uncharacterized protein n=1 Tax=Solanum commersonii TaxID=4109 RepID=A0A9J6AAY3_SOLCO|nr:hypothetical protein H5410_006866 [Solanum commersonii]